MTWNISSKEIESVSALPAEERYEYFIKRAADMEIVWSLGTDEGWALASDDEGREVVPVWPHERYAELCATGEWTGNSPRSIDLEVWLQKWLPGIEGDHRLITVFPTASAGGLRVSSEKMKADLEEELASYGE